MISGETYEELYEILGQMDKVTVMKIPEDILNNINSKRNKDFKTKIDKYDLFNEENIRKETVDLLCWLDYNYWMNNERKEKVKKIISKNLEEENDYKREKYNPEKIFETTDIDNNSKLKNQELTEIPKDSFFTKLKKIFMRFFKKNHWAICSMVFLFIEEVRGVLTLHKMETMV